ncbi:hypothetical protein BJV82DRAFT_646736 [Fennellomyces sp. T-0311]|nr:hypothetical protein BJV82DRAFT_646736 [Fennellomyces sp. T-0311]
MILLILYYVYKWMTVPWSYYESARSRRLIHQKSSIVLDERKQLTELQRRTVIAEELRRHELVGLLWVIASPLLAGYTLQYSRYFLSNYERYMSSFNVVVFVLAASLKPLAHVMTLLRERTFYLQSEMQASESQVQMLQRKLDLMEDELDTLRKAFATKKDLGQVTDGLNPTIQQLAKTLRRFEKKETALRSWSEDRFSSLESKVHEFDQFICYRIEQDQRQSAHGMVVTLVLLPLNITLWVVKQMTGLLPVPRHASTTAKSTAAFHHHSSRRPSNVPAKHLTHPDSEGGSIAAPEPERDLNPQQRSVQR